MVVVMSKMVVNYMLTKHEWFDKCQKGLAPKLTCPKCNNYVFPLHSDELMEYFLRTEETAHKCEYCGERVVICKNNISYVHFTPQDMSQDI